MYTKIFISYEVEKNIFGLQVSVWFCLPTNTAGMQDLIFLLAKAELSMAHELTSCPDSHCRSKIQDSWTKLLPFLLWFLQIRFGRDVSFTAIPFVLGSHGQQKHGCFTSKRTLSAR